MALEKPITLTSVVEKRDANKKKRKIETEDLLSKQEKKLLKQEKSQEILERPEKKRRIRKQVELAKEEFHSENESTIFTGPENLPFETADYQPASIDDLELKHLIGKEELLPTPEDAQEEFLIKEFKTLDPGIIQEKIKERVASGEYTETPFEGTHYYSQSTRPKANQIERYRSLNSVTQEELEHEERLYQEMISIDKAPLSDYKDLKDRPTEKKPPQAEQGIWKNLKKWLSGKQEALPDSHYAKPGRKTGSWFNEFLSETKQTKVDPKAVSDFIEKQHKLASLEDDSYSEQEDLFEEKFKKEIAEESIIENAAEQQKASLRMAQEAYDKKMQEMWSPFLKERAQMSTAEQQELDRSQLEYLENEKRAQEQPESVYETILEENR